MSAKHHYRAQFPDGTVDRYSVATYTHAWRVAVKGGKVHTGFAGSQTAAEITAGRVVGKTARGLQCTVTVVTVVLIKAGVTIPSEPLAGWRMLQQLRDKERFQEWTSPCGGFQVCGWPDRSGRPWVAVRGEKLLRGFRAAMKFKTPEACARAATAAWRQ